MQWTNGIVFSPANFPTTNATVEEQLKGILHWSSVSFAIKEKFEKQIVKENELASKSKGESTRDLANELSDAAPSSVEIDSVISFKQGLIGFEKWNSFQLIAAEAPFYWLQSTDKQELRFLLLPPFIFLSFR